MMTEQAHVPYYCLMNGSLARGRDLKCGEAAEAAAFLNPRVALCISGVSGCRALQGTVPRRNHEPE
jgi:hypothetical protein